MEHFDFYNEDNYFDPVYRSLTSNTCFLRSYQAETLRTIYDAVLEGKGGRFTVTFPRQSGKNETQAQLEAAVMAASQWKGGSIIKIIPTEKNQGRISTTRLADVLQGRSQIPPAGSDSGVNWKHILKGGTVPRGQSSDTPEERGLPRDTCCERSGLRPIDAQQELRPLLRNRPSALRPAVKKDEITYGTTRVRCLSASPNAAIVGATADLLLEVDEAQLVPSDKFDREAAPMAASTNAVQVFWGTVWDDQTLLARETRLAVRDQEAERSPHVFHTTAAEVSREVPEYADFVRGIVESLGREHPAVRTQFFCEEITDLTSMFTPERINKMKGDHDPLYSPERDHCYVFLIDVAGSDEITPAAKKSAGFSDRRDATVVTICDVSLPEGKSFTPKNFVWKAVARRLFRNLNADMLEKQICQDIDRWNPRKIIIDHSGLGAMLSDILTTKYKHRVFPVDITAANKTKMAWDFLAMVDTGRWIEHKGDELTLRTSGFKPGREHYEILKEPELLQQMFYRELRACRIEPTGNPANVRWGVRNGTRDHATGRILHDDLVMSAALAVFESGTLPLGPTLSEEEWKKHYEEIYRMVEKNNSTEFMEMYRRDYHRRW